MEWPQGVLLKNPEPRLLREYRDEARAICKTAKPAVNFREALQVYRGLRNGLLIFRCTIERT